MNKLWLKILPFLGLLLILLGLFIYGMYPVLPGGPIVTLVGFLCVIFFIIINRKEIKNSFSVRSAKYGTNTLIFILTVLLIVVFINIFVERNTYKIDMTIYKSNTLSKQTQDILSKLDKNIEILGFISSKDTIKRITFKDFCELYNYNSKGKVTCRFVEPDDHPLLAKEFHVFSGKSEAYGFKSGDQIAKAKFLSEEDFTSAIIRLNNTSNKNIYFVIGHAEGNVNSVDPKQFSKLKVKLQNIGYNIYDLSLTEKKSIPSDCTILVLLSPKTNLLNTEIAKIGEYLNKGGSALMMFDPFYNPNVDGILSQWGLLLDKDILIDRLSNLRDPFIPLIDKYPSNPIFAKSDKEQPLTFFNEARSVRIKNKPDDNLNITLLLQTSGPYSFGETDLKNYLEKRSAKFDFGKDLMGPVPMAYTVEKKLQQKENDKTKLVVIGNSSFANNLSIDYYGNGTLILNILNWLSGDTELISIDRPNSSANIISLTNQMKKLFYYICIIFLPLLLLIAGGTLWWNKIKS